MFGHGYVPLTHPPGLWGAYADYMYLDPFSLVHPMRKDVPVTLAVMFNPLGAGFRWAVEIPDTGPGDTVLVLGPGQRGLACVIAARAAGADTIIVTGIARDGKKLALARELGADHTIDVEAEDVRARVRELTGGRGADVVIEVSANAPEPVGEALHYVAAGGRVVLAGGKGFEAVPGFVSGGGNAGRDVVRPRHGIDGAPRRPPDVDAGGSQPLVDFCLERDVGGVAQRRRAEALEEAAVAVRVALLHRGLGRDRRTGRRIAEVEDVVDEEARRHGPERHDAVVLDGWRAEEDAVGRS